MAVRDVYRDGDERIIQFRYGDDCMRSSCTEQQDFLQYGGRQMHMREATFLQRMQWEPGGGQCGPAQNATSRAVRGELMQLREDRAVMRKRKSWLVDCMNGYFGSRTEFQLAVNIDRLVESAKQRFCQPSVVVDGGDSGGNSGGDSGAASAPLTAFDCVQKVRALVWRLCPILWGFQDPQNRYDRANPHNSTTATQLTHFAFAPVFDFLGPQAIRRSSFNVVCVAWRRACISCQPLHPTLCFIRSRLASKRVVDEDQLSSTALDWVVKHVEKALLAARAEPGYMAGLFAAQFLGEAALGMAKATETTPAIHMAGVSYRSLTSEVGLTRLKELLQAQQQVRTPQLTIYLKDHVAFDRDSASKCSRDMEFVKLSSVTKSVEIAYDPDPMNSAIEEDREFVQLFFEIEEESSIEKMSPWLLRIELDHGKVNDQNLDMNQIADKIRENYGQMLHVVHSDLVSRK